MKEYNLTASEYNKIYYKNLDGKYIIEGHGVFYWKDGFPHREDGPSSESANGTKIWYIDGKYHRLDGPAIIWHDGYSEYYINDKFYDSKEEYEIAVYLYINQLESYK